MALTPVALKPIAGHARQFDGTLDAFLDIINARPKNNLSVTCTFDAAGAFTALQLSGGSTGTTITATVGDWVIFPDNPAEPPVTLNNSRATTYWQAT